jgi:hypothetical protein
VQSLPGGRGRDARVSDRDVIAGWTHDDEERIPDGEFRGDQAWLRRLRASGTRLVSAPIGVLA